MISTSRRFAHRRAASSSAPPPSFPPEMQLILRNDSHKHGNLFIGNVEAASFNQILQDLQVRAVLCAAGGVKVKYPSAISWEHSLPIQEQSTDILELLEEGVNFITEKLQITNVLVHCIAGMNRAAAVVAAFLIQANQLSTQDALCEIQSRRKMIHVSTHLQQQLMKYENNSKSKVEYRCRFAPQIRGNSQYSRKTSEQLSHYSRPAQDQVIETVKTEQTQKSRKSKKQSVKFANTAHKEKTLTMNHTQLSDQKYSFNIKKHIKSQNPQLLLAPKNKSFFQDNSKRPKTLNEQRSQSDISESQRSKKFSSIKSKSQMEPLSASRLQFNGKMRILDGRNAELNRKLQIVQDYFQNEMKMSRNRFEYQLSELRLQEQTLEHQIEERGGVCLSMPEIQVIQTNPF